MANVLGEDTSGFGDFALGRESFDLSIETFDWDFDIGSELRGIE
jgi:hypothetical protein